MGDTRTDAGLAAIREIEGLSLLAQLIITLDRYTRADLQADPPRPGEKLGENLGLSDERLDRFVRPWINEHCIAPHGGQQILRGGIDGNMTFAELCARAGIAL